MSHSNIQDDVKATLRELAQLLAKGNTATVTSFGCYDPALSGQWQLKGPGGPYVLVFEQLPGHPDLMFWFMSTMLQRGVNSGVFHLHLKCKYLYEVQKVQTSKGQRNRAEEFTRLVDAYNAQLGVNWQVAVEEGGSAPI